MIEEQHHRCHEILQTLLDAPCAKLFWKCRDDAVQEHVVTPVDFELISVRLSRGVYASPFVFISNVRMLLSNITDHQTGFRRAAGKYLSDLFERELRMGSPADNQGSLTVLSLERAIQNVQKAVKEIPTKKVCRPRGSAGAEVVKTRSNCSSVQAIVEEMTLLGTSKLILRVASFVRDRQPECVLMGNSLQFHFGLMTSQTRKEVHEYVHNLIVHEALGLDP